MFPEHRGQSRAHGWEEGKRQAPADHGRDGVHRQGGADELAPLGLVLGLLVKGHQRLAEAAEQEDASHRLGQPANHLQHAVVGRAEAAEVDRQED